jgi:hypothetical protein
MPDRNPTLGVAFSLAVLYVYIHIKVNAGENAYREMWKTCAEYLPVNSISKSLSIFYLLSQLHILSLGKYGL